MRSEQRLRKNLKWFRREIETPLWSYVIASIFLWMFIGVILLLIEHRLDFSQITSGMVLSEMLSYGICGIFFAVAMHAYARYQVRQIEMELD